MCPAKISVEVFPLYDTVLLLKKQRSRPPRAELWTRSRCGTFYSKVPPHNLEIMRLREEEADRFGPLHPFRRALG
jgi:hypothetical protein